MIKINSSIIRKEIFLSCLLFSSMNLHSKDLGVVGDIWPIKEKSLVTVLEEKAKNQDVESLKDEMKKNVKKNSDRPAPLNLPKTNKTKLHEYVPLAIAPMDLKDPQGHVFVKKGTSVNALTRLPLFNPHLSFINADDDSQVLWAKKQLKKYYNAKIILTGGSVFETEKKIGHEVFFDQQAKISQKFGITHVPATVVRNGLSLDVIETAIKGDGDEI